MFVMILVKKNMTKKVYIFGNFISSAHVED